MPEYFAILLVTVGIVLIVGLAAVAVARQMNRFQSQVDGNLHTLSSKVNELSDQIAQMQQASLVHGRNLEAIRAEFAVHVTRNDASNIDYEQAIKAAAEGFSASEVSEQFGLRDAEARLLVAVYGSSSSLPGARKSG